MRHASIGSAFTAALVVSIAACEPDGITDTVEPTEESDQAASDSIPEVRKTAVGTPEGCHVVSYEVRDGLGYFEDDIILGPVDELARVTECAATAKRPDRAEPEVAQSRKRGAVRVIAQKWPGGIVYFETPTFAASAIQQAIALWNSSPELTFIQIPPGVPLPRIRFVLDPYNPNVASSSLGMQGGAQQIKLGFFTTGNVGVIAHEIGHALGMPHEQTRVDRDTYVAINWFCIQSGRTHNFEKSIWNVGLTGYDYRSIMHYRANQFSWVPGCNTIIAKNGNTISPSSRPTRSDLATINAWY